MIIAVVTNYKLQISVEADGSVTRFTAIEPVLNEMIFWPMSLR